MSDVRTAYGEWTSTGVRTRIVELIEEHDRALAASDQINVAMLEGQIEATARRAMEDAKAAVAAEEGGDDATATWLYKKVADLIGEELGARACLRTGQAFLDGHGVERDYAEAERYLTGALKGGEIGAAHAALGRLHLAEDNERGSASRGLEHLRQAIAAGDDSARFDLASALYIGKGAPQDRAEAVRQAEIAATSGDHRARVGASLLLATAYETGGGVVRDAAQARHWLGVAGELGYDVKDDLVRLNQGPSAGAAPFPILSTCLLAAWLAVLVAIGASLSGWRLLAAIGVAGALAVPIAYYVATRSGASARGRVAAQFQQALDDRLTVVRIGGVKWAVAGGEFHRLAFDSGDRGQLVKEETSRAERRQRELGSSMKRRSGLVWIPRGAVLCALALFVKPLAIPVALVSAYLLAGGLFEVAMEVAYRRGNQWIVGAMALDPAPYRLDRMEVERQKVHGDSRLLTEAEAVEAGSRRASGRSPLHDQEF